MNASISCQGRGTIMTQDVSEISFDNDLFKPCVNIGNNPFSNMDCEGNINEQMWIYKRQELSKNRISIPGLK